MVLMERDPKAKRQGYTSRSYQWLLEDVLVPLYKPRDIFQQDNAPIHTSSSSKDWFERHGIEVPYWPPHSPDLQPIELAWKLLKDNLYGLYPNLMDLKDNEFDFIEFQRRIQHAWETVSQEKIDNLIDSIPRRLRACKKARGWYAKY